MSEKEFDYIRAMPFIISLLFHSIIAFSIFHVSAFLPSDHRPLIINFTIEKAPSSQDAEITQAARVIKKSPPKIKKMPHTIPPPAQKKDVAKVTVPDPEKKQVIEKEPDVPVQAKETETVQDEIIPAEPLEERSVHHTALEDTSVPDDTSAVVSAYNSPALEEAVDTFRDNARNLYIKQHYKYISRIIQSNISYPHIAKKMLWEGKVILSFIIKGDGTVQDICIERSSGYDILDKNAEETVRNTAPFPAPVVEAKILLPIVYRLL
jgi:protein TonB